MQNALAFQQGFHTQAELAYLIQLDGQLPLCRSQDLNDHLELVPLHHHRVMVIIASLYKAL